jgi:hypothetical protein
VGSLDQRLSAITGGYDGGDVVDDAMREMAEETGYVVTRAELLPLGESFALVAAAKPATEPMVEVDERGAPVMGRQRSGYGRR